MPPGTPASLKSFCLENIHVHRASRSTSIGPRWPARYAPHPRRPGATRSAAARTRQHCPPAPYRCRRRRTRAEHPAKPTSPPGGHGSAGPAEHGCPVLPVTAGDVADYLMARHAAGASPATVRAARAAIAKVHRVSGFTDPTADGLCGDVLGRIGREGLDRGRGQVAAIGWQQATAAARRAEQDRSGLRGLRDRAIILLMSDSLARISEVAALQVADVEEDASGGGTSSSVPPRPISSAPDTPLPRAGHAAGGAPLPAGGRPPRRACSARCAAAATAAPRHWQPAASAPSSARGADAIDGATGSIGGHSLRVGSARDLAAAGASVAELQQAGGLALACHAGGLHQTGSGRPRSGSEAAVSGGRVDHRRCRGSHRGPTHGGNSPPRAPTRNSLEKKGPGGKRPTLTQKYTNPSLASSIVQCFLNELASDVFYC